jgi:uncharacterized protein
MNDLEARMLDHLHGLVREVNGVTGALLATTDGHPIVHNLPSPGEDDASRSTAAMIAALLGVGQRLSDLTGDPRLSEATVRSPSGSVVIYAVGAEAVITLMTDETVNLARLNLAVRLRIDQLAELVDARVAGRAAANVA